MICTNDTPVTDAELEAFYGKHVTEAEREDAIQRQTDAFDSADLSEVVAEISDILLVELKGGYERCVGDRIQNLRKATIARRASMELYGKPDVVKASEVWG